MNSFLFIFLTLLFSFSAFADLEKKIDPNKEFFDKGSLYFEKYPINILELNGNDYCFYRMAKRSLENTPDYYEGNFYIISLCSNNFIRDKIDFKKLKDPKFVNGISINTILESSQRTLNCNHISGFEIFNTRQHKLGPSIFLLGSKYKKNCLINRLGQLSENTSYPFNDERRFELRRRQTWLTDSIKIRNTVFLNIKKLNELKYLSDKDYLKIRYRYFKNLKNDGLFFNAKYSFSIKSNDWFLMMDNNKTYQSLNDNLVESVLNFLNDEELFIARAFEDNIFNRKKINKNHINKNRLRVIMESIGFKKSIDQAIGRIQ